MQLYVMMLLCNHVFWQSVSTAIHATCSTSHARNTDDAVLPYVSQKECRFCASQIQYLEGLFRVLEITSLASNSVMGAHLKLGTLAVKPNRTHEKNNEKLEGEDPQVVVGVRSVAVLSWPS